MNSETGSLGEIMACKYFEKKGYRIMRRNISIPPYGEIDALCRSKDGTLVFLEVKTVMESLAGFLPEDHASGSKLKKMKVMAQMFSAKHPELVDEAKGWRIDLVAITFPRGVRADMLTFSSQGVIINHYENVA